MFHSHPSIEIKVARDRFATIEATGATPEWMQPKRFRPFVALRAKRQRRNAAK